MRVLVVGNSGAEHALARTIARSTLLEGLYCAPGNAGTAAVGENVAVAANDVDGLINLAREQRIDLTVVCWPAALAAGIADRFADAGLRCLGPSAAAAKIEADKPFAKQLMRQAAIPTAEARVFGNLKAARLYVASRDTAVVVKAAGYTAGQGVFVCQDPADGILAVEQIMKEGSFGPAGDRVLVEECLQGTEVTVPALVDGRTIYVLEPVQFYRRLGDGDDGPITAGMGAFCPTASAGEAVMSVVEEEVFLPLVDALNRAGKPYRGILSAELMLTPGGPKVLSFHTRLGACAGAVLLARLGGDCLAALDACFRGELESAALGWDPRPAVGVVLATGDYPPSPAPGLPIVGLDAVEAMDDVFVCHEQTARQADRVVTAGGRVVCVSALGVSLGQARQRAYAAVEKIHFEGMQYRKDIAAGVNDER